MDGAPGIGGGAIFQGRGVGAQVIEADRGVGHALAALLAAQGFRLPYGRRFPSAQEIRKPRHGVHTPPLRPILYRSPLRVRHYALPNMMHLCITSRYGWFLIASTAR